MDEKSKSKNAAKMLAAVSVLLLGLVGTNVAFGAVVERRVAASSDDAEEHVLDGGKMERLASPNLELGYEVWKLPKNLQTVGIRLLDIPIDKGTTITNAWVQFSADDVDNDRHIPDVSVIIEGELSPNPATFTENAGDISSRPTTTASVVWDIPRWMEVHLKGPDERTPDISPIIQEIVNQDGWAPGNAIVLMFRDNPDKPSDGTREAESFEDGGECYAPLLHIEFGNYAGQLDPADGAPFTGTWVTLTWTPGATAALHDVYFSDNLADVNDGTAVASTIDASCVVGLDAPGDILPTGLVPGTTYYWRVDEVEADGTTIHKGDVWSFTVIVTDPNLIGWWKFDEGQGAFAFDWSGHGNTGIVNCATWVADGQVGGALDLDGNDDYVVIDAVADDITDNNFSVSAWIKTTQTGNGNVIGSNTTGSEHDFIFGVDNGRLLVEANNIHRYPPKINDDQWHHIAYVRDGNKAYAYTDGVLVGTETPWGNPSGQVRWSIGMEWDKWAKGGPSDEFDGMVDDVRIYNIALSEAEIQALATPPQP